ncbi:hypothetical protein DVH24_033661 [Malus domestica]|uniref:Gnk2-homologous domain-containing protein n=1 Tax=Malus domestica TaxID=3750 RepID=A0A498HTA9_MALDO|nr:hypothetical protein DVH24_033661 [Malus domestica]
MLRYSDEFFFSRPDHIPLKYLRNKEKVTANEESRFYEVLEASVNELAFQASNKSNMFATKKRDVSGSISLQVLGQCTQDLSSGDCYWCLQGAIAEVVPRIQEGGRLLRPSCRLTIEVSRYLYLPNPSSSPPLPPPPGSNRARPKVYLSHICPNTTTFTPNSTFQSNLNRLLSNLSSNANRSTGFYNVTVQTTNNAVYGLFLCRGDVVSTDACETCVATATTEAPQRCPVEKQVVIWYDDCMLRYSNVSFFSTVTESPRWYMWNTQNATDPTRFNQVMAASVNQAASEAVGDADKFGTNQANVSGLISVYSLGQCTQDLSATDCNRCLRGTIALLPSCCNGALGARVLYPSCNVRYEVYPFYAQNATSAPEPAPGPPPPLPPPTKGKSKIPTRTIVAIVVPISVSVLLFVVGYCCITRRARKKYNQAAADEPSGENDITTVESLQFDFATIQAATSNFSDDHKLGEGGFGQVYKVC